MTLQNQGDPILLSSSVGFFSNMNTRVNTKSKKVDQVFTPIAGGGPSSSAEDPLLAPHPVPDDRLNTMENRFNTYNGRNSQYYNDTP